MSFGFSVSDIVTGYKLASNIYHHCFTRAERADIKYHQFGREVNLLGDSLQRLGKIIENADVQHPQRPWRKDAVRVGPNTLQEVTGDFLGTLSDCQSLLEDNSKFHRTSAGFIDNVMWWSATEREVTALRERVHFHVTKVTFIAKPFETQLLLGIRRELQQLRREVAVVRGILVQDVRHDDEGLESISMLDSPIPENLAIRFTDALYINKPSSFDVLGHLPLKESFDALVFNFANSTVEFNPMLGLGLNTPEEPQYLNLVKSKWIAGRIEDSHFFRAAGADSLWADYLRELKDDIRDQFVRFEAGTLVAPSHDVLSRLPDSCFSIWVVQETSCRPADLAEPRPFEYKILEIGLPTSSGNRQSALTVFYKSDINFRLVSTTKDEQNRDFHREESTEINMNVTRLIPAYANPDEGSKPTHNVLLCASEAQNPRWYSFKEAEDVARFQQALTGYRVFHCMSNVSWSIEGSSKPHKSGLGSIQLWHHKPLLKVMQEAERKASESRSSSVVSPQSPGVGASNLKRHSTAMTGATLVSASNLSSSINGARNDGVALLHPEPPALVIFTMSEKRYTFLQIKLDQSISTRPDLCDCHKAKRPCTRVVLGGAQGKAKTIDIRRHRADQEHEQGLYAWDLALFRSPQHAKYRTLELFNKKYMCLDFPSIPSKDEFLRELKLLEHLRNLNLQDYSREFEAKKYLANNPGKRRVS